MSFSLSGSTITQTGTDNSLAGLGGISGVTVIDGGTDSNVDDGNTSLKKVYFTNNRNFVIDGVLNIDPLREVLIVASGAPRPCINVNGTLRLGKEVTINDGSYYNPLVALEILDNGKSSNWANSFKVQNGAAFEILGCIFKQRGRSEVDGLLRAKNGIIMNGDDTDWGIFRLHATATTDVDNLKVIGGSNAMTFIAKPADGTFNGYEPIGNSGTAIDMSGDSPNEQFFEFNNYKGKFNGYDFPIYSNTYGRFKDPETGTNLSVKLVDTGLLEVVKKVQFNVTGDNVQNNKVKIYDINNGNRGNKGSNNYISDRTYEFVTDVNGDTVTFELLLGVNFDSNDWDYRGKNNNNSDVFDVSILSYINKNILFNKAFKGNNTTTITRQLSVDLDIVDIKSNVDSYTVINDSQQLYDYTKALIFNSNASTEEIDALSVSGSTLVIKNTWKISRDQSISTPVAFDLVNKVIKVKTGAQGLKTSTKFTSFSGEVDSSFVGNTDMVYLNDNGTVNVKFIDLNPEGFVLDDLYRANVLVRKVGETDWTVITVGTAEEAVLYPLPNENWEYMIRVPGYEWIDAQTFNSGSLGTIIKPIMVAHRDLSGNTLFSRQGDEGIISSFTYDFINNRINQANTSGTLMKISFTDAYIGLQRILHNPSLVTQLTSIILPNLESNGFTVELNSTASFKLTDNSNANVQLLFTIEAIDSGEKVLQIDRFIPSVNGNYILMSSEVVSFSSTFPSTEENAIAVSEAIQPNFDSINNNLNGF